MRPPVELHRPTVLNLAALACYCLAVLFHVIAYATDSWSTLSLEGVTWSMGLWRGCRRDGEGGEWHCSSDVFKDKVFQTGSDWHVGSRVMMTLALVFLFLLEFAIIAYACIKNLERFKSRLVGLIIALSVSAGLLTLATIALAGSKCMKLPGSRLEWSFGVLLLSLVFQLLSGSIVAFDLHRLRSLGKSMRKSTDQFFHRQPSGDSALGLALYNSNINKMDALPVEIGWSFALAALSSAIMFTAWVPLCIDLSRKVHLEIKGNNPRNITIHKVSSGGLAKTTRNDVSDDRRETNNALLQSSDFSRSSREIEYSSNSVYTLDCSSKRQLILHDRRSHGIFGKSRERPHGCSRAAAPLSVRTSRSSLSEADTYRKFENNDDPTSRVGSYGSLVTKTTEMSNLSYNNEWSSMESTL